MSVVLIIQGGPAVGKSTLAHQLAQNLGLGIIAKDDIKELLFDKLGLPSDRDDSRVYGVATLQAMFAIARTLVAAGKSFMIESAFHKGLAEQDFTEMARGHQVRFVQLYCHTTHEEQQKRYEERVKSGTRHPGHHDTLDHVMDTATYDKLYAQLDFPTIDVDTTNFGETEYALLLERIKKFMEEADGESN